jgi:hypothetical protein
MSVKLDVTRDTSVCVTSGLTFSLPHFKVSGTHSSVGGRAVCDMTSYQLVDKEVVSESFAAILWV